MEVAAAEAPLDGGTERVALPVRSLRGSDKDEVAEGGEFSEDGKTPLLAAVASGRMEAVRARLEVAGVDVNEADREGRTPLYTAVVGRHLEVARVLLRMPGVDVNRANCAGQTPLIYAVASGDTEMIRAVLEAPGVDVNLANTAGQTPLYRAVLVLRRNLDVVRMLLALPGVDVNRADNGGRTPLYRAIECKDVAVVRELLEVPGIDIFSGDPMAAAIRQGYREVTALLEEALYVRRTVGATLLALLHQGVPRQAALVLAIRGLGDESARARADRMHAAWHRRRATV